MEQSGFIKPKLEETNNLVVSSAGFSYDYVQNKKVEMQYYVTIAFPKRENVIGKYIIVEFQDPIKKEKFYKNTILVRLEDKSVYLKSSKLYGFNNMNSYLVKIALSEDKNGEKVLDKMEQYVRVEYIPQGYLNEV